MEVNFSYSAADVAIFLCFLNLGLMFGMQREEIRFMIERDGSAKGLVFSQFTSFLDLISYSLQKVIKLLFPQTYLLLLY